MNNKKIRNILSMEWIVVPIMGLIWNLITYVVFYTAKIGESKNVIFTIPFFLVGTILMIGGLMALFYNILARKRPNSKIVMGVVFETIGLFWLIMSILLYIKEVSFGALFPALLCIIFIVEGIRLPKNSFKDRYEKDASLHRKQLYGYKGITATQWWFGYSFILAGLSMFIYATPIVIRIIGIVFILFGLYCYVKKAMFYTKFNQRKNSNIQGGKNDFNNETNRNCCK